MLDFLLGMNKYNVCAWNICWHIYSLQRSKKRFNENVLSQNASAVFFLYINKFCTTLTQRDHTWLKIYSSFFGCWCCCLFKMKCLFKNCINLFTWTHCSRYSWPFFGHKRKCKLSLLIEKKWNKIVFFCGVRSDVLKQSENQILFHKHTVYESIYICKRMLLFSIVSIWVTFHWLPNRYPEWRSCVNSSVLKYGWEGSLVRHLSDLVGVLFWFYISR